MNPRALTTVAATRASLPLGLMLICVLIHPASAQMKTDRERDGLAGPVRIVRVERADFTKGPSRERMEYSVDCYDRAGNRVTCGQVESTTVLDGKRKRVVLLGGAVAYTYDAKDRIAESSMNDPDGSLFARFVVHYDDRGFMVERIGQGGDGDTSRETFVYDERGNLAMEVDFALSAESPTAHPSFKWTYTYDNRGLLVETAYYNLADGREVCTGRGMNRYDSDGRLVGRDSYDARGSLTYTERYDRYEFDSQSNWIKRVASRLIREGDRMRREADQVIYRTISYY